jgi:hypothetical protein
VQFQQRLLRHRAEKLHAEIVTLQLHPGTFADIQRLQKEWGRHAHYEGECTQDHCIYQVKLPDLYHRISTSIWDRMSVTKLTEAEGRRIYKAFGYSSLLYRAIGGRPAIVNADVEVRNNRTWGANFNMGAFTSPGVGRNDGQEYMVAAQTGLNSRLLIRDWTNSNFLLLGYSDSLTLNCAGCEVVSATFTAQTDSRLIERFNQFNFACIGPWHPCKHPENMAPNLTAQAQVDTRLPNAETSDADSTFCKVPIAVRAREAEDILLVQIVAAQRHEDPDSPQEYQVAQAIVKRQLKNATRTPIGSSIVFETLAADKRFAPDELWKKDQRYFLLYREPKSELANGRGISPCNYPAESPENLAEIRAGIALDGSTGEPWDWQNQPGALWMWH